LLGRESGIPHAIKQMKENWLDELALYRELATGPHQRAPSGADFIAQLFGGVTLFDAHHKRVETQLWPFSDLSFVLIRTGFKLATHTHLQSTVEVPEAELRQMAQPAIEAFNQCRSDVFVQCTLNYAEVLRRCGLLAPKSEELIRDLILEEKFLGVKGCGALGADILIAFFSPSYEKDIVNHLATKGLEICGKSSEIGQGLSEDSLL
jgi:mevalonate kinase